MSEKVVRDGKVAVIYSPGFGAGWYSWNSEVEDCLFDPELVSLIERGEQDAAVFVAASKWPDGYWSGPLAIEWLPVGTHFRIHEYDGNESVEVRDEMNWHVA